MFFKYINRNYSNGISHLSWLKLNKFYCLKLKRQYVPDFVKDQMIRSGLNYDALLLSKYDKNIKQLNKICAHPALCNNVKITSNEVTANVFNLTTSSKPVKILNELTSVVLVDKVYDIETKEYIEVYIVQHGCQITFSRDWIEGDHKRFLINNEIKNVPEINKLFKIYTEIYPSSKIHDYNQYLNVIFEDKNSTLENLNIKSKDEL